MCQTIVINRGETDIESPRQFIKHFGFNPIIDENYEQKNLEKYLDSCLCPIDIEKTLTDNSIPFKYDYSDYYVGDLDNVVID